MTLAELIKRFRVLSNDKALPYFWSDEEVTTFINAAQEEAAIRGRLILEVADPDICNIALVPGQAVYTLSPRLYELSHISVKPDAFSERTSLKLVSTGELDSLCGGPGWRDREGAPKYAMQADKWIRFAPIPQEAGTVNIEGYILPVPMLLADQTTITPEINQAHHEHLVQWALYRAFSIPDTESFDPNRSQNAEEAFTEYFGSRPDSDLRRITREDTEHHVEAFWV